MTVARNTLFLLITIQVIFSCKEKKPPESSEYIRDRNSQERIFSNLLELTGSSLTGSATDSLAFLILPVQSSCPSCRAKTIKSILKHQNQIGQDHIVVISAHGGRKTINSYFRDQNGEIPRIQSLFLDTIDRAGELGLYEGKPTMYYGYNRRIYKKVAAVPATIKQDLNEYFNGPVAINNYKVVQK